MAYKIIQKEKDLAGKWRYWVEDEQGNVKMLKFSEEKKDKDVFLKAQEADLKKEKSIENELEEINRQIETLTKKKAEIELKIANKK